MARIRSIKPEFFTSETLARVSISARLTFIGLWTYVDDNGVGLDNERLIDAALYPLDDDPLESLRRLSEDLRRLSDAGVIARYEASGRRYVHITNWDEHQKVSHPGKPRFPLPPNGGTKPLTSEYDSPPEVLPNDSGGPPESLAKPSALSREQGAGSREQGSGAAPVAGEAPDAGAAAEDRRAAKPRSRATQVPDDFEVTEDLADWAQREHHLSLKRIEFETKQFLDHHRARGTTFKNWHAAWRTWMGRVNQYSRGADPLPLAAEEPAPRPPWCGACDERTRMIRDADQRPSFCKCHHYPQEAER